jgi:Cupin-like domain
MPYRAAEVHPMHATSGSKTSPAPIREFRGLADEAIRRELFASWQPAVLRGLVGGWRSVALGRSSPPAIVDYLRRLDNGTPVDAIMTPPEAQGRIFYDEGMTGFNFVRNRLSISSVAEQVLRYAGLARPPAVAVQSALIPQCLPGFTADNPLPLLEADVQPRIWLGNAITTPTHLDEWHNIGCVVSGRRRFTLFPPEQIANLYIGPLDFAPTGAPMSLVRLHEPDFERFPKFREALAASQSAVLGPGDAIYIPPLWWHHVESLDPFNLLVNYWWHVQGGAAVGALSGFDGLRVAMLNLRSLPAPARAAWRSLFEHYVFGDQTGVTGHIPPHRHGLLGALTPAEAARLREQIAQRLKTGK